MRYSSRSKAQVASCGGGLLSDPKQLLALWIFGAVLLFQPHALLRADLTPFTNSGSSTATVTPPKPATAPAADDDSEEVGSDSKGHSFQLKIDNDDHHHESSHSSVMDDFLDDLIPLAGIICSFGMPVLIVFFISYFRFRKRRENLALAREYLNKGMAVPSELLDPALGSGDYWGSKTGSWDRARSDLRQGAKLVFVGFGIVLALGLSFHHQSYWAWGMIPVVMGLGRILIYWVESRMDKPRQENGLRPPLPPDTRR